MAEGESLEAMVARINATAFLHNESFSECDRIREPKPKRKKRLKPLERLSPREQRLLLGLMDGSLRMLTICGVQYAVGREGDRWTVSSTVEPTDYIVENESCTCPDCKFRERACKHLEAIYALTKSELPS